MLPVFAIRLALAHPQAWSLSLSAVQCGYERKGKEKGAGYNLRNKSQTLHSDLCKLSRFGNTLKSIAHRGGRGIPPAVPVPLGSLGTSEPSADLWQWLLDGRQRRSCHEREVTAVFGQRGQQSPEWRLAVSSSSNGPQQAVWHPAAMSMVEQCSGQAMWFSVRIYNKPPRNTCGKKGEYFIGSSGPAFIGSDKIICQSPYFKAQCSLDDPFHIPV